MKRSSILLGVFSLLLLGSKPMEVSHTQQPITPVSTITDTVENGYTIDLSDPYLNCLKDDPYSLIIILAKKLEIDPMDLYVILFFESGGRFDPLAENPNSSSKGLLQINNSSVIFIRDKNGKYLKTSKQMLIEYPTLFDQLKIPTKDDTIGGPVYQYLNRLKPYKNSEDLFMAVFLPPARGKQNYKIPRSMTNGNFGIKTAKDYVDLAYKRAAAVGIKRINMD